MCSLHCVAAGFDAGPVRLAHRSPPQNEDGWRNRKLAAAEHAVAPSGGRRCGSTGQGGARRTRRVNFCPRLHCPSVLSMRRRGQHGRGVYFLRHCGRPVDYFEHRPRDVHRRLGRSNGLADDRCHTRLQHALPSRVQRFWMRDTERHLQRRSYVHHHRVWDPRRALESGDVAHPDEFVVCIQKGGSTVAQLGGTLEVCVNGIAADYRGCNQTMDALERGHCIIFVYRALPRV